MPPKRLTKRKHTLQFRSMYLFSTQNKFRLHVHEVCVSSVFEHFILLSIFSSVLLLAIQGSKPHGEINRRFAAAELSLNIIFCMEASLKIIANGFVMHPGAYLRKKLNIFDFFIVLTGIISDVMTFSNTSETTFSLSFLRIFRLFRPLRLIVKSENLCVILDTIIKAFASIVHVLMFILLIIVIYSISGMELFGGLLHNACFINDVPAEPVLYCAPSDHNKCFSYFSRNSSVTCREYEANEGLASFDNMAFAMLTTVQVLTMEDWVFLVYTLNEVISPYITWPFFVSLIWVGGYFAVDLLMGVLGNQYLRTKHFSKKMRAIKRYQKQKQIAIDGIKVTENLIKTEKALTKRTHWYKTMAKDAKKWAEGIITTRMFFVAVMSLLLTDAVITTIYCHVTTGEDISTTYVLLKAVMISFYLFEMCLILLAKGIRSVLVNEYAFSSFICLAGIVELLIFALRKKFYIGLSIIRCVNLIQVFRKTRFWSQLSSTITSFIKSIQGVAYVLILMLVILINYALLGNQLFGKPKFVRDRLGTFDDFGNSLLISFVLLTGDNWTDVMYNNVKAVESDFMKVVAIFYFVSFALCGNFILMNIFLGIIVDNLTSDYERSAISKEMKSRKVEFKTLGIIGRLYSTRSFASSIGLFGNDDLQSSLSSFISKREICSKPSLCSKLKEIVSMCFRKNQVEDEGSVDIHITSNTSIVDDEESQISVDVGKKHEEVQFNAMEHLSQNKTITKSASSINWFRQTSRTRARAVSLLVDPEICNPLPQHKSLFIFSHQNALRKKAFALATSYWFTCTICVVIVMSSLAMAFDEPLSTDPTKIKMMNVLDIIFTAFFVMEILLKVIAYGLVFGHENCYLRNPMNILDAIVVCISVVNIVIKACGYDQKYMQLRILRVARVVRMLKISSNLKRVINCLANSLKRILYFLVTYLVILFLYSVIGVHLYRHLIGECKEQKTNSYITLAHIKSKDTCIKSGYLWYPERLNFDSLGDGMITLFVLSTMDDWFLFLKLLMKLKDKPEIVAIVFVVSFIIIMSFVILNVFIGFVIVVFHQEKDRDKIFQVLDKDAQESILFALTSRPLSKIQHEQFGILRQKAIKIANSTWFSVISFSMIILNTLVLMTYHYKQDAGLTIVQTNFNLWLTLFFTLEMTVRLLATPLKNIIKDSLMMFDLFAVFGSWIDIFLQSMGLDFLNLSVFRLFRVARLVKVMGRGADIRQLFATLLKSMKSVPSIACLLGLIIYVYAIIGMELFGRIETNDQTAINKNTNFQSFTQSVLLLIRVTTLDAWHKIMLTCADVKSNNCIGTNGNCGSYLAYLYFSSFVLLCSYIMTNIFLAIIMENFVYLTNDIANLDCRHIHNFEKVWSKYDVDGKGQIKLEKIIELLRFVDPPLGLGCFCPPRNIYAKLAKLRVPIEDNNTVKYTELLFTLVIDSLRLEGSCEMIRSEIQNVFPMVKDTLLDRVLPLEYDPRVYNENEKQFYEQCASNAIKKFYKIYRSGLRLKSNQLDNQV